MNKTLDIDFITDPGASGIDPITWTYFDQLLNHRTIVLNDSIGENIVELVYCQLKRFEKDDSEEPVTLILNTCGGSVFDGLFICNVIDNYTKDLNIYIPGYAFSMGAIIACAGANNPHVHKYCYEMSFLLYHSGSLDLEGDADSVKDTIAFTERLNDTVKDYVLSHSTMPEEVWNNHLRKQWYLTAEEALQYGIVNEIIGRK